MSVGSSRLLTKIVGSITILVLFYFVGLNTDELLAETCIILLMLELTILFFIFSCDAG